MTEIPVIELRGAPRDRGRQHGEALRDRIERALAIYALALGRSDDEQRAIAAAIEARVRAFAPPLAEEIEGIAEGASVPPHRIWVLNARSELMAGTSDGCTSVFVPAHGLLGQNWDWLALLEPLVAVLRIEPCDGPRLATLTEPGMLGKIGCNEAGLGVCLNFVYAPGPLDGVPVHVVLRDLLHQRDLAASMRAHRGRAANVLVGSARGRGLDVVWLGRERRDAPIEAAPFAHTNHVGDDRASGGPLYENSVARLARAQSLVSRVATAQDLFELLADRADATHPIGVSYRPYALVPQVEIGTVAAIAMELDAGRMHVRLGPDPSAPIRTIDVV